MDGALPAPGAPLYRAVQQALLAEIRSGVWGIGASLPSEAALSDRFGVSRITTRHALRLLESDGVIRKARARRPVVTALAPRPPAGWTVESLDDIVAMVGDAELVVGSWRRETAPEEAARFERPATERLPCLRSVLRRGGVAYARSIIYLAPGIGAGLRRRDFDDAVVFRVIQRETGVRIRDVRLTVWAELAGAEDAAALPCRPGDPLLVMRLLYRDEAGRLIEAAYSRSLASEVRLSTRLTTGQG